MLKSLQAGRALAATSVAAFHLSILMGLPRYGGEAVFRQFTRHGDLGVDFFFVLSGFIILHAHIKDIGTPSKWRNYAYRRLVRIYPIYWFYTAVFAVVLMFGVGADAKTPTRALDWLTSLALIRFSAAAPPLSVAWTLFHELAFYSLFAILIFNRRIGTTVCLALALAWIAMFEIPFDARTRTPFNVYFSVINLEFFMGMGSYWLYRQRGRGLLECVVGLLVISCGVFALRYDSGYTRLLFAIGFAIGLAGIAKLEERKYLLVPALLALIGDASYSIYLVHVSVEGVMLKLLGKVHLRATVGGQLSYVLVILATVCAGVILYLMIEKPLLRTLKPSVRRPSAVVSAKPVAD